MATRSRPDDLDDDMRGAQADRQRLLRNLAIAIVLMVGVAGIVIALLYD
jgi:hypothetical protein